MRRLLSLLVVVALAATAAGCGGPRTDPPEGCKGHGGVQSVGRDATNNDVPFACKDGTIGKLHM